MTAETITDGPLKEFAGTLTSTLCKGKSVEMPNPKYFFDLTPVNMSSFEGYTHQLFGGGRMLAIYDYNKINGLYYPETYLEGRGDPNAVGLVSFSGFNCRPQADMYDMKFLSVSDGATHTIKIKMELAPKFEFLSGAQKIDGLYLSIGKSAIPYTSNRIEKILIVS